MATEYQSVFTFLNLTTSLTTIDRERMEKLRSSYDTIVKTSSVTTMGVNIDDQLKQLAQIFMLIDDATNIDHLKICVTASSIGVACEAIFAKYADMMIMEKRNAKKALQQSTASVTTNITDKQATNIVEYLSHIICQIIVKQNEPAVIGFIHNFLLSPVGEATSTPSTKTFAVLSPDTLVHGPLNPSSILDAFIRSQLMAKGGTINVGRPLTKFSLVEPITLVDEFDTWHFDQLRGLFELNLVSEKKQFPSIWRLASNAKIFFVLELPGGDRNNDQENVQTSRIIDRPSTASLEQFVEDVCEKENNGMASKWIGALRADDLFTFDHLANLKYNEWSELKVLTLNGRKVLKSYIDREKQTASDAKTAKSANTSGIQSHSELLAYLHQIKLYFHHILADLFADAQVPTPAKLDARCVHLSFDEMRKDGFADDGLFDEMKMFFLPLTMIEEDLAVDDSQWRFISQNNMREQQKLLERRKYLLTELSEKESEYYRHDDNVRRLRKEMHTNKQVSADENGEGYGNFSVSELLDINRQAMEQLDSDRNKLRTQLQAIEDLLSNIEQISMKRNDKSDKKKERDLIKPNRGFIMYGPPGTGKSDIMSKLSTRMGVNMVAPPIAAGELNRPLVGESERVILDICMRCHRTPYLMCCVSIDEIDSLAPKRTDDSSDGNVAKLSVLLSVIDGIKDVPNLMIFCATNRLHTMDEAFLRRMSGKFFVGRPSSRARKSILSGMKPWHLSPHLLENLTTATTNFSGAALRALRRLITVHCVDAQRINPRYQLDYRTMLQLTDTTARQYRILIGAETLPTLLLRTLVDDDQSFEDDQQPKPRFNDLPNKPRSLYTGKIIINLHARRIDIESILMQVGTDEREKVVYQEFLRDSETNLQELLERLTVYGKSRNVQLLQLIDLNLLSAESAYDEKDKFETLKERLDECAGYRRSMIVYDLDSLIGVNKSEGNSSMGRSTNFSLINQNVYTYVKDKFQTAYIEPSPMFSNTTENNNNDIVSTEKWSVMVIRDQFLLRQFCDDVQFTRTSSEIEEEEAQMRSADERIKCVQCNDYYIEPDNKMGVCMHHDGFVYDNHSLTLDHWGQRDAVERLLKEEAAAIQMSLKTPLSPEEKERMEREKLRFKYICCNQTVQTASSMGGCKKGKHSPPNMTLLEWEYACDNHKDYQDKRLNLLRNKLILIMATNRKIKEEEERLQAANIRLLRELELSQMSDADEQIARQEFAMFDEMKSELEILNRDNEERIHELDAEIQDMNQDIDTAESELNQLNEQLERFRIDKEIQDKDFHQMTARLSKQTDELERTEEELLKFRRQELELAVECDKWQTTLIQQQELITEEKQRVADLGQQMAVLENNKRLLEKRSAELTEELKAAETEQVALQQELAKIDAERVPLEQQTKRLQQELAALQRVVQQQTEKIRQTQEEMAQCEQEINALNTRIQELEQAKQQSENEIRGLEQLIERIEEMIVQAETQQREIEKLIQQKNEQKQAAEQEQHAAESEAQQLQQAVESLNSELQEAQNRLATAIGELNECEEKIREAENEITKLKELVEQIEEEVETAKTELTDLTEQHEAKQTEVTEAEAEKVKLEATLTKKQKELQEATEEVTKLEQAVAETKSKLDEATTLLNQNTETLRKEEQNELDKKKELDDQQKIVNDAKKEEDNCTNAENAAKKTMDAAILTEQTEQAAVQAANAALLQAQNALKLAQFDEKIARDNKNNSAINEKVGIVRTATQAVHTCEQNKQAADFKLSQASAKRQEATADHQSVIDKTRQAKQKHELEKKTLMTKDNEWNRQIGIKKAAERQVNAQKEVVTTATDDHKEVKGKLDTAKEQKTTKTNEFNDAEAEVQKQTEKITKLTKEATELETKETQAKETLTNTENKLKEAQEKQNVAEENLKTNTEQLRASQRAVQEAGAAAGQKQQALGAKQAEHAAKQGAAQQAKNNVAVIGQDIALADANKEELENEKRKRENALRREREKSQKLNAEQDQLKAKVEQTQQQKQQHARQVQDLKNQLDTQNGAMMEKSNEVDSAKADLQAKEQHKAQLQSQRDERTARFEQVKIQIRENEQGLQENGRNMKQMAQTIQKLEVDKQTNARTAAETEQHLRQRNERLQQLSNQVGQRQQVYDELQKRNNKITVDVEQRQVAKERLEKNAEEVHNQWTSKRIWLTTAMKNVTQFQQDINNIKLTSRQQQQQERQNMNLHHTNDIRRQQQQVRRN
ncbi:unnamed protein product [Adineta steineri]|uniref:AAA+ ATPase domain-containing protein n=1 Tax=Adineta steineri TaxID=433720 RepID=A0A814N1G3_9BILA|nr:unnamed protein product [Adineta steineri]CAF1175290.1 unnamed protein product [Adineta steineri]